LSFLLVTCASKSHIASIMSDQFSYRPKFVDIRVRKPPTTTVQPDVQMCEHDGCSAEATNRAPKKNWNFFEGMTEADAIAHREAAAHGGRPTWSFKASANAPDAHTFRKAAEAGATSMYSTVGGRRGATERASAALDPQNFTPAPVLKALETMGLDAKATASTVRAKYASLVRQFHPDSNGGDRSAESRLNAVVKAYKVLKTARRA
jgi:hypothetical protein